VDRKPDAELEQPTLEDWKRLLQRVANLEKTVERLVRGDTLGRLLLLVTDNVEHAITP